MPPLTQFARFPDHLISRESKYILIYLVAVETKHIIRQDQKTIRVIKNSLGNYENYTQDEVMFYDAHSFFFLFQNGASPQYLADRLQQFHDSVHRFAPINGKCYNKYVGHSPAFSPGHITFSSILLMGGIDSCDKLDTDSAMLQLRHC